MANNMRRPIDSLFGRLALLVVVVLLLSHFAGYALFRLERSQFQNRYAVEEATFLVDAVRQHVAHTPDQPLPSRVRLVDPASSAVPAVQQDDGSPLNHFLDDVRDRMPPGTQVRLGEPGKPPTLWVRQASDRDWIVVPVQPLRPPRSVDRMVLWLTIIFTFAVMAALFAAWQLQQPLRSLASAVARFGRGQPVPPVPERGPRELRQLTHGFNQMVQEVARTENDRAVMLAGVAHDLKTPLARLRLRAEMMDEAKVRDGVVRDVDSMTHIVEQFLVFAHDGADRSEAVEVDAQCERVVRSYRAVANSAASVLTDLKAGPGFLLPAATLDRILSNLLDNAHAYGQPPVIVSTARTSSGYTLAVQDNGQGIAAQDLMNASRPFVRLDPARGGNGHSGLGLAIVERLVRRAGGEWEIGNHGGRGLRVLMTFPFEAVPRMATVSESAW
ncbi:two-component system, OmpR family, osmolarity sensor histidine kinase EnvZ [Paraburkholderia phenazinium]|jgi:two-component system, OmpR family, osmolarity sensor histidine kinase EnvZ|uniref:histidine kinase n=2 Tax=Paraburkholderia phenazinium TaxID=60549 RepID=A0A1N6HTK6_9BURK|nr:two-component system, OmpR family, osmolarity sensor histidine kinase EnvZ [Paraburkholderia phenazinium]